MSCTSGIQPRPGRISSNTALRLPTPAVFEDPKALTIDQIVDGEQRHATIGMDAFGRILVVVYTWRGEKIRIISARKATRIQVQQYENE
jgi:uncharacterized DUF497 family protein